MAASRPFRHRLVWILLLGCCSMALLGCGPSLPPTYPVKGKVVNKKNNTPFKGGQITFQLTSDPTVVADGAIADDGSFTVTTKMHGKTRNGAAAGEHHVMVENDAMNVGADGQLRIRPLVVSKKYTVEKRDNDFTIEVESK